MFIHAKELRGTGNSSIGFYHDAKAVRVGVEGLRGPRGQRTPSPALAGGPLIVVVSCGDGPMSTDYAILSIIEHWSDADSRTIT